MLSNTTIEDLQFVPKVVGPIGIYVESLHRGKRLGAQMRAAPQDRRRSHLRQSKLDVVQQMGIEAQKFVLR